MISSSYPQKVIDPALLFLQVRVLISLQRSQFEQRQLGLRTDGERHPTSTTRPTTGTSQLPDACVGVERPETPSTYLDGFV